MIVKFDSKTTNALRAWFKRNGLTCGCGFSRTEKVSDNFWYIEDYHRIELPKTYDDDDDFNTFFVEYLIKEGLTTNAHWLTLSILHEVGHSETTRFFTDKEIIHEIFAKIELGHKSTKDTIKQINYEYWHLPSEDMANKWAITYANRFPNKVKQLEKLLFKHCEVIED